jgi:hypothetical protein
VRSPASGDRVSAVEDRRAARHVQGILNLRFVPSLSYVQVEVLTSEGLFDVDPRTIEVIEPAVATIEALEADDPITKDPSWRRIVNLAQAAEEDLLELHDITGGTWEEMFADLDAIVAPLVTDGWEILDRLQEESSAHGDSVMCSLKRGRTHIDVELFHDSGLQVWDGASSEAEGCYPPLFVIEEATPTSAAEAFRIQRWLPSD